MKQVAILIVLLTALVQIPLHAQEREPLVMRIMLEWTAGGVGAGALVGGAVWLTDPGKKGNKLSEQAARGAAWGAIVGAIFALTVVNNSAIPPAFAEMRPGALHPAMRITSDPIGEEDRRMDLLAAVGGAPSRGGGGFVMPVLNLRF
ncbi:MAG: hypothetical protein O7C61_12420 [SAR324 cluster bacterium]|nr:hypothetical protein [SAR324 cluster bacterium]